MHILWADDPAGLALFRPVHVGTMYIGRVVNPGAVALVRCSHGGITDLFSRFPSAKKKNANAFKHIRNVKHSSHFFISHVLLAFELFLSCSICDGKGE